MGGGDLAKRLAQNASSDLGVLKDALVDGSKKLGTMASDWFNSLESYGS